MNNHTVKGFTLIEVMIAMTLLSLMMVLLFGSLRISAESWNKGETKISQVNQKATVYQFFKHHLPAIKPLWDDFSEDEPQFSFHGEQDNLQFVSVLPASSGRKGLQQFKVFLDKKERGLVKVKLTPFFLSLNNADWQDEEAVVLAEQVAHFEISYFFKMKGAIEGEWHKRWVDKKQLPTRIKINIALIDESYWPEMVFSLKNTTLKLDKNQQQAKNPFTSRQSSNPFNIQ